MTKPITKPNNYAFIDSQNLNLAIKGLGWQIDFKRFRIYLKDRFSVSKAFLFIGYMPGNESLYTYLQNAGYVLVFKPILEIKGKIKGNVDAELVLHAMIEYGNYDKAVIVSGDGDFHCLVEYLINQDKLANLVIPNQYKYSSLLRKFVKENLVWFLNKERQKLEHKKREA
ncbi:MAG: NYN domain-containing protein [Pseudomonadota bacterium]